MRTLLLLVVIVWQEHGKKSSKVYFKLVGILPRVSVERHADVFGRWYETVTADCGKPRSLSFMKRKHEWMDCKGSISLKNPFLLWDCECDQYKWVSSLIKPCLCRLLLTQHFKTTWLVIIRLGRLVGIRLNRLFRSGKLTCLRGHLGKASLSEGPYLLMEIEENMGSSYPHH